MMVKQLRRLPPDEIGEMLAALERLDSATPAVLHDAVVALLESTCADERNEAPLVLALAGERLRDAAWSAVPQLEEDERLKLAEALLDAESAETRTHRFLSAFGELSAEARESLARVIIEPLFHGKLDAEAAAALWPSELRREAFRRAQETRRSADKARAEIEKQLELGEKAYLAELRDEIEPLVARASARAAGNSRLQEGYDRLAQALQPAPATADVATEMADDLPDSVIDELAKIGARVEGAGPVQVTLDNEFDGAARVRYLVVLDQRAHQASSDPTVRDVAARVLPAYSHALGSVGIAERILRDLFQGGPLLPVALQLSPTTRELLLNSAQVGGFEPPIEWRTHSALGEWLRTTQLDRGAVGPDDGVSVDRATLATAFRLAQAAEERLAAARDQLERLRHSVKEDLARAAAGVFDEIDALIDSYAQLWQGLSLLGIQQIAPLGLVIDREDLEPRRHEIVGDATAIRFVVRSPGVVIDGEVAARARVEGVVSG
jgi:hypothetical protein